MKRNRALGAILMLFVALSATPIFAQEVAEHELSAQIFYPLTTTESRDDVSHLNFYLLYSRLGSVDGADVGYGYSRISGDMEGLQYSAGLALVGGDLRGVSFTGFGGGVLGTANGVQWSGLTNWARGGVRGVQAGGVANVAGPVEGVQTAGLVNVAGDLRGVQASGILNVAGDVKGVQLGLINIADRMKGVPIGLVNLSRNGGIQLSGWTGGVTEINSGVRFRSGAFYTMFGYGLNSDSYDGPAEAISNAREQSSSFSFGGRIPAGPFYINLEGGLLALDKGTFDGESDQVGFQYRGMVELPLFWGISVFGGIGSHYLAEADYSSEEVRLGRARWDDFYFFGGGIEF